RRCACYSTIRKIKLGINFNRKNINYAFENNKEKSITGTAPLNEVTLYTKPVFCSGILQKIA
ncbi:MAG: hypothetical protein AABX37_05080, partial [Nanoarchaeota archaeon]